MPDQYGPLKTMLGRPLGALPYAAATTGVGAGLGWLASKGVNWLQSKPEGQQTQEDEDEAAKRTRNWMLLGGLGGLTMASPDLYNAWDASRRQAQPDVAAMRDRYNNPSVADPVVNSQLQADKMKMTGQAGTNPAVRPSYDFSSGLANPGKFFEGYPADGQKNSGAWDVRSFDTSDGDRSEIGHLRIPNLAPADMGRALPWATASRMLGYDPSLSPTERVKFENMLPDPSERRGFSVGDLVQAGIGAGLGYGAAYGLGQVMHGLFGTSKQLTASMARAGAIGGALKALKVV